MRHFTTITIVSVLVSVLVLVLGVSCASHEPRPDSDIPSQPAKVVEKTERPGSLATILIDEYQGALHTVNVTAGGVERPFLFDTGGGISLLTPTVAEEIGCEPYGNLVGFRMRAERIDFQRCDDVALSLGSVTLEPHTVGVFDLMPLLPPGWDPLGGLLGLATLEDRPFTLALGQSELVLESPASFEEKTAQMSPADIRLVKQASGFSTVVVMRTPTPNGDLWLELDSGSTAPLMLAPHAARMLGVDLEDETNVEYVPATEARSEMWKVKAVTLDLGPLGTIETSAVVLDMIYDANLGAPLMERLVFAFDLANEKGWVAAAETP